MTLGVVAPTTPQVTPPEGVDDAEEILGAEPTAPVVPALPAAPGLGEDLGTMPTDTTGMSDEDRDRVFQHNAKPYLDQAEKSRKQLEQYYESQGLRFSDERREKIGDMTRDIYRQMAEAVMVPQIEREQGLGLEAERLKIAREGMQLDASQWAQQFGLEGQKFAEAVRQYDTSTEEQKNQFAESMGLSRDELDQRILEFDKEFGLQAQQVKNQEEQFAASLGLDAEKFAEARRQFDTGTQFEQERLAAEMGLSWAELDQRVKEFDDEMEYRERAMEFEEQKFAELTNQWAAEFGMDGEKFAEAIRQFDTGSSLEQERLAAEMGLSWKQLDQRVREFDQEMDYRDRALELEATKFQEISDQWAAEFGLDTAKFAEAARQFDTATAEGKAQFAAEMGMEQAQLAAAIQQFNAQMELEWDKFDLDEIVAHANATGWWDDFTQTLDALMVNFETGVDPGAAKPKDETLFANTTWSPSDLIQHWGEVTSALDALGLGDLEPSLYWAVMGEQSLTSAQKDQLKQAGINITGVTD